MPNAVMAVATGKALLLELGKGTQQGERWLSISKKEIEPSWLFFPIKRLRTSRTRLSKWRQNQKKVRLWVETLAKSCPSLRQRFCLLGCWRAACTEGLQEPHMHGATFACQSHQPASMGRAEMVILLLVVEMGFRSQMHLQFGTWMHVQKQPGYCSAMCCDPGPFAAL